MKQMITFLFLGLFLMVPAYGSGAFEQMEDGIHEIQQEVDSFCHGRYEQNLTGLAELVALYIDDTYNVGDLKLEMGLLHAGVVTENIICLISDERNPRAARETRLRNNYNEARGDIKAGLKQGKRKLYFVGIFAGYGLKSLFDFILP